jgi:pyruvate/2-oxoglutarate dehydrogenase complex dihydrolipoamide acyltransferase (E2) component
MFSNMNGQPSYKTIDFPRIRQPIVDSLRIARRMDVMHALFEADVTAARRRIRELRRANGRPLSFTAYLAFCLARAIAADKSIQAYRRGSKLIIHDDVHLSVIIERKFDAGAAPMLPPLVRSADRKTYWEIEAEIAAAKTEKKDNTRNKRWLDLYWYTPGFIRRRILRRWMNSPHYRESLTGTVALSAVGMFGNGAGWGIPIPSYTLTITAGTIARKPVFINGKIENHEFLSLTASFDHAVVDGAPAARFTQRFKDMIEECGGL